MAGSSSNRPTFETTCWSVVMAAGQDDSEARQALQDLCGRYWFPLFAFARRRGKSEADAEDLVQAFFVRVLESSVIAAADRSRGRFRTFLLTSLDNFMRNEHAKQTAQRRGGGQTHVRIDLRDREGRVFGEISEAGTAEAEFHRQWALALLDHVLKCVQRDYEREGKAELFRHLRPYLSVDSERKPYSEVADAIGQTEGGVKTAVHRLRRTYRRRLEQEIALTVESADQVDDEIQELFRALQPN